MGGGEARGGEAVRWEAGGREVVWGDGRQEAGRWWRQEAGGGKVLGQEAGCGKVVWGGGRWEAGRREAGRWEAGGREARGGRQVGERWGGGEVGGRRWGGGVGRQEGRKDGPRCSPGRKDARARLQAHRRRLAASARMATPGFLQERGSVGRDRNGLPPTLAAFPYSVPGGQPHVLIQKRIYL